MGIARTHHLQRDLLTKFQLASGSNNFLISLLQNEPKISNEQANHQSLANTTKRDQNNLIEWEFFPLQTTIICNRIGITLQM